MALKSGSQLGPYEILGGLGAGGMGEVYRARDTRLHREVAIKVLPDHLAEIPELRQRLEREARTISSLEHPNICTLYDIGSDRGVDYLVMEFLDGETLAERLVSGPLPIRELLSIAVPLADALDKAHRKNLVHRDLKPGNIILTPNGPKLVDFGLAKWSAGALDPAALTASVSPGPLTAQGAIVGTYQYMSPEQLEGQDADARSDLFAFGAILYEMATGRRAFDGKTQASVIAAVLERDPVPVVDLQPLIPAAFDQVIRTCLAKDPAERCQNSHDLKLQLEWIRVAGSRAGSAAPVAEQRRARQGLTWGLMALWGLGTIGLGIAWWRRAPPESRVLRAEIFPAPDTVFSLAPGSPGLLALSPDGRHLAWAALGPEGATELWVRTLDQKAARRLDGTTGAIYPFWSPDSRRLAFFANGTLRRIDAAGGQSIKICDAFNAKGGTWSEAGEILFAPDRDTPIFRVGANGGEPIPVTELDAERQERSHRHPHFLPDGEHFVYLSALGPPGEEGLWLASLEGGEPRRLTAASSHAEYAQGHLLFVRGDTLMAQPFDARRLVLSGEPTAVVEGVYALSRRALAAFSVSQQGLLAYQSGGMRTELTWHDRHGEPLETLGDAALHTELALAPDEERAAAAVVDSSTGTRDLWVFDLARGAGTRLTFDPWDDWAPVWSRDGRRIFFVSVRGGGPAVFAREVDGAGDEVLIFQGSPWVEPTSVSPDGRFLAISHGLDQPDLLLVPLEGDGEAQTLAASPAYETEAEFSPLGQWVAYVSDASGSAEVYVSPFPGPGRRVQVSTGGGFRPRWRGDGRELLFATPSGTIMAAEVTGEGGPLEVGLPNALFQVRRGWDDVVSFDVTSDGQRFLFPVVSAGAAEPITLVVNWAAELAAR